LQLPDSDPRRSTRSTRMVRACLALGLALLVGAPLLGAPRGAAAAARSPRSAVDEVAPEAPKESGESVRSIHYEQALAHEADVIEFEPGDRVTVPFKPRKGDTWEVDGKAPRALPAGRATGGEMRAAPKDAIWSLGPPPDLASPGAGSATSDDQAITVEPASYTTTGTDEVPATAPVSSDGLRREVFGFLPYWEVNDASTTLDWRTLSTVAYFSVGCLSNGNLAKYDADGSTTTGWGGWTSSKMTSIITAAHEHQSRVVLTISCFAWSSSGVSRQAALLGSATARATLAKAAAAAVRDRGADGINLDFEPIVSGYSDEYTALVRAVRSELNKVAPGYQLTFDTLGWIGSQPIVDATAPGGADAVFIMGYDYRTDSATTAGSISPLTGPRYDLTDTVKAYTAKISPSKVILGVPYYGRAWSTGTDSLNASTLSGAKYGYSAAPTYGQAMDLVAQHGRRWDSVEQTPWTAYPKQTCTSTYGCVTSWRQLYYDDATSLRLRYDLVNRTSLRGTGIWALGYDGTRPELREALADKFLADSSAPVAGIVTLPQTQRDEGFRVAWTAWDDSTIAHYDTQVARDGGSWAAWLTGTKLTSGVYLGETGHTYAFRVRGADVHGNVTPWYPGAVATAIGMPTGIAVGGFASVLVDGLRMRTSPNTGAAVMTTLSAGDALRVVGGPVTGEGYTWWQVTGPVRQWGPVDPMQVGGWIAAAGNGSTYAGPRRAVYATRVDAGIVDMTLNGGGLRVLTPNGDGSYDKLHLTWTNRRAFDSLALRVFRTDGTLVGNVTLGGTGAGPHAYDWDGRIGGVRVAYATYVLQLRGLVGSTAFSAPSASPVSSEQIRRTGLIVAASSPTAVKAFARPASPTNARSLTWKLTFGGAVTGLTAGDFWRAGTAAGCVIGAPVGSGASWSVTLTGCGSGTVTLYLKARSVADAVHNWGPASQVNASAVLIDRSAPSAVTPRVVLRSGVQLPSTSTTAGLLSAVLLAGTDTGGAGVASYDVRRSIDGGAYVTIAYGLAAASRPVTLTPGHTYRFMVRARDRAGNVGAWVTGPTISPYLRQQTRTTLSWTGTWTTATDARFSGGSARYATAAGASMSYSFGGRSVAWVTTLGPSRGAARVYIDGVLTATVDLKAPTTTFGRVAFAKSWTVSGWHTIRIVAVGTLTRPRVDVDALEILG
jgi:spore germination protein YaaH